MGLGDSTALLWFLWGSEVWASFRRAHSVVESAEARWRRCTTYMRRAKKARGGLSTAAGGPGRSAAAEFTYTWDRLCALLSTLGGACRPTPRVPPSPPVLWHGFQWWRTVQPLADHGPVDAPHPHKNWTRLAQAAILAWAGDVAHESALDRSGWAAGRPGFVLVQGDGQNSGTQATRHRVGATRRALRTPDLGLSNSGPAGKVLLPGRPAAVQT